MRTLQRFLIDTSNILKSEFERSSSVKNTSNKGDDRELFIKNFLEKTFPKKFVIEKGEIIDSDDKISKQADIIIYDEFMPILDYGSSKHFLSGGVLSHIEVKSFLDSTKLNQALDITKSIKSLKRDLDITISMGDVSDNIPSFIFAYDGMEKDTFKKAFLEYYKNEKNVNNYVDGICVLNKYVMKKIKGKIAFVKAGDDSLMFFFSLLFSDMYKNWSGVPNLLKYWESLHYELF